LTKYNYSGLRIYTRLFGTANNDICQGLIVDFQSNIVLVGMNNEGTNSNIFITKFNPDGDIIWSQVLSSDNEDTVYDVTTCGSNIYLTGSTKGTFSGNTNNG